MKEARFIKLNKQKWQAMEQQQKLDANQLAANFVELSDDLAYARTFYPGSDTERYLNQQVGHYLVNINGASSTSRKGWWTFWGNEYPRLLAAEHRNLWFAFFFFLFAALIGVFSAAHESSFVRLVLGDAYVNMTLENIASGNPMGVYAKGDAWSMFFYITSNNIRVAFTAFAFGLLFSGGTLWILFFNGLMLGAFQYFFYEHGLLLHSALSIWAHGTFEITSIIIAGGAGLVMGNSFLFPGTYPRLQSFRLGALKGIKIVAGLVPFFILAGWIESFITRYADQQEGIGLMAVIVSWIGVIGYFVVFPLKLSQYAKSKN